MSSDIEKKIYDFLDTLDCQSNVKFPEVRVEAPNIEYAKLLYSAYADGESSELQAVTQYLYHSQTIPIEEISNSIMCIALVEMRHLDTIGDLIKDLGGKPFFYNSNEYFWSSGSIDYVDSTRHALKNTSQMPSTPLKLELDIQGELSTINHYEILYQYIEDRYIRKIFEKIISDEKHHIKIFQSLLDKYFKL